MAIIIDIIKFKANKNRISFVNFIYFFDARNLFGCLKMIFTAKITFLDKKAFFNHIQALSKNYYLSIYDKFIVPN